MAKPITDRRFAVGVGPSNAYPLALYLVRDGRKLELVTHMTLKDAERLTQTLIDMRKIVTDHPIEEPAPVHYHDTL